MTEKIHLSRRKVLGSLGAIGGASAAAGLGTTAFFSDQESFGNNQLVAGSLDMKLGWESHYSDWSEDEAEHAHMEDGELVVDDQQGFLNATLQQQFPMGGGNVQAQQQINGNATPGMTWDFGDAPDQRPRQPIVPHYPTKLASDGARHRDSSRAFFGTAVTKEPDARSVDVGDEGLIGIRPLTFLVTNEDWEGDLYVNALFDWRGDGSWEPYEQQSGPLAPVPSDWVVQNMKIDGDVPPGTSEIFSTDDVLIPLGGAAGWLRLTLTSEPISDYAGRGEFEIGETEDYFIPWGPGFPPPIPLPIPGGPGPPGGAGGQWFEGECDPVIPPQMDDPNVADHRQMPDPTSQINLRGPSIRQAVNNPTDCSMNARVTDIEQTVSGIPCNCFKPLPVILDPDGKNLVPVKNLTLSISPDTHPVEPPLCICGWLLTVEIELECPPAAPPPFKFSRNIPCEFLIDHCEVGFRFPPVIEHVADIENEIGVIETDADRFEARLQEVESMDEVSWKRVTHLREQRNDLADRIGAVDPWIEELLNDVADLKSFWADIPDHLSEQQSRLAELQDDIDVLKSSTPDPELVDRLAEQKIEELVEANDRHREAIATMEDNAESYDPDLLTELIEERESVIAENEETINLLEDRNKNILIEELESDEELLTESITQFQELDEKADERSEELDERTGTILDSLDALDAAVADFEDRLDDLFDPCVDLADVPDDLSKPVIDLADVKPGDFGMVTFDFLLCDNPGYVWLTGSLVDASENGWTEPELDDPDEDGPPSDGSGDGVIELLDAIEVQIWYDDDGDSLIDGSGQPGVGEEVLFEGTLSEALDVLPTDSGLPLDGDRATAYSEVITSNGALVPAAGDDEDRECFSPSPTPHCIGFRWELPRDAGNEVQSDTVRFDLGFYTEQCRHNDGSGIGNAE